MTAKRMRGFTLIEVAIAFAILGMALTVLYGAFENALSRMRHDALISEGTLLAQSLLSRAGIELAPSTSPILGDYKAYHYQLTQELVTPPNGERPGAQPLLKVSAMVTWTGSAGSQSITLSTLKQLQKADP